ncbi:MAG: 2Fe-2S iron-sulfur cluster-binding protein [Bacteroidia bacterium]|nr:2Fe-2S iron-sulfur cluster-binding protein [Bacteroidia bacterium]
MVKLKINNTDYEAPEGLTILDVAKSEGFSIPTLCYKDGLPHYSSCMVCLIKDNKTNSFVPSCSALIQDGMDIDISGEEVISIRRKAIELLLSEHRAECEAPCKVVCPAGYNIPLMNRFIAARNFEAAVKLSLSELYSAEIMCTKCPGYCENACRRKKIDLPVSIRNIKLFIFQRINQDNPVQDVTDQLDNNESVMERGSKMKKSSKRFRSHIGRLEENELQEWLKECSNNGIRSREISDFISAAGEAESCMHCDCRAADDCRLRDLAEEFTIKDPKGKLVNSPILKKINHNTGLIFENAKCIKCGLCVRICEDSKEEPALCFIHRGFVSIISEPLTEEFDNILKTKSKEVIEICPTGALSQLK